MLIDGMNEWLIEKLENAVDGNDPTKAGLIRPGFLQDNPLPWRISVLTFANDPDSPESWAHTITRADVTSIKDPSPYDLSGGQMMYRRFLTTLDMYWNPSFDRQTARQYANVVLSRAEGAIRSFKVYQQIGGEPFMDDFGEMAMLVQNTKDFISDGGGPGQFIHHAKIYWQVLTGRSEYQFG
jgi:hypothetical protein